MSAQKVFCHYGDGGNGKSKVMETLNMIAGSYSNAVMPDDLVKGKNGQVKSLERIGAKLKGKRVLICDDMEVKAVLNEALLKCLTSLEVVAEDKYVKAHKVLNRAKVHMGLNVLPEPEAENTGIIRRLCIIPYNVTFSSSAKAGQEIDDRLRGEVGGILNWAVEGYRRFKRQGDFRYPPEVMAAIEDYKQDKFSDEVDLTELYQVASDDEDDDADVVYLTAQQVAQEMNLYRNLQGFKEKEAISPEKVGRTFKRVLKIDWQKKRIAGAKNQSKVYRLKRVFDLEELKSDSKISVL